GPAEWPGWAAPAQFPAGRYSLAENWPLTRLAGRLPGAIDAAWPSTGAAGVPGPPAKGPGASRDLGTGHASASSSRPPLRRTRHPRPRAAHPTPGHAPIIRL